MLEIDDHIRAEYPQSVLLRDKQVSFYRIRPMANCFCILPAPDSHIEFNYAHPQSLSAYLEGEQPDLKELPPKPTLWQKLTGRLPESPPPPETPEGWPTVECVPVGDAVNHRNVDLFHRILNGTDELVTGGGSIFQTWLESGDALKHSAIDLTRANEDYAFMSDQVADIAEQLSRIDLEMVRTGFQQWLIQQGRTYEVSDDECVDILEEFERFADSAKEAVQQSKGLMVIKC